MLYETNNNSDNTVIQVLLRVKKCIEYIIYTILCMTMNIVIVLKDKKPLVL